LAAARCVPRNRPMARPLRMESGAEKRGRLQML